MVDIVLLPLSSAGGSNQLLLLCSENTSIPDETIKDTYRCTTECVSFTGYGNGNVDCRRHVEEAD